MNRTLVVYHLHGQTGRFTVWVNSSQSSLGRIQDFFLGGGGLVSCSTLTPINHIVFFVVVFFCRIPVVLENGRSSHTRSAPGSGLVNFVPESRLPFVEMSSIYRKTAVKAWNWYQRWLWRALKKWNTNFRLEYSIRRNRTTFSGVPMLPEIFRWEDPNSRVPYTFQLDLPEIFCKW